MAKYLVIEDSFINGRFAKAGEEVDYAGIPGFNLNPLDDAAIAAKKQAADAQRNVNGRAFQEDLTRPDGTSAVEETSKAEEDKTVKKAAKG
ncbi:hypothetical protein [Bombella sp. ESL0385]|uniref:hypothetical protein n=1 Tax=Bombella sp. ESL0385 TaxID=2676446 RepID=UPI0012D99705|nr:hypothetical protein [Bombella sp. ESL0385]MUG90136.1 hypothetical protein [Bombella sp. ESL0385]